MIQLTRGETLTITARLKENEVLQDLSSWDIKAAVRTTINGTVLYQPTVNTSVSLGTFSITLSGANTASLPVQELVLAIRLEKTDGIIRTVNERLNVNADQDWQ